MEQEQAGYGFKVVPVISVRRDDDIALHADSGDLLLMHVDDLSFLIRKGDNPDSTRTFAGPTYALTRNREPIPREALGKNEWTFAVEDPATGQVGTVLKLVPAEESDFK